MATLEEMKPCLNPLHSADLNEACIDSIIAVELEVGGGTMDEVRTLLIDECGLSYQDMVFYLNRYRYSDAT
jgi:hypothetical protein